MKASCRTSISNFYQPHCLKPSCYVWYDCRVTNKKSLKAAEKQQSHTDSRPVSTGIISPKSTILKLVYHNLSYMILNFGVTAISSFGFLFKRFVIASRLYNMQIYGPVSTCFLVPNILTNHLELIRILLKRTYLNPRSRERKTIGYTCSLLSTP